MPGSKDKELSEKEIAKLRDETLKRMLKAPPKPHSDIAGDSKKKSTVKKRPAK